MTREVFVAGQILTAAELNVVSDQTVMSFASAAARDSAISSPTEGMTAYLEDSNSVQIYDGSAWKRVLNTTGSILQVVSTTKTDTFTTTSTAFTDVSGLSATITPSSTSSKILCVVTVGALDSSLAVILSGRVLRGATVIGGGDASGSTAPGAFSRLTQGANQAEVAVFQFLDSPSSTSALTYLLQVRTSGGTLFLNRAQADDGSAQYVRSSSTITLMEVAG